MHTANASPQQRLFPPLKLNLAFQDLVKRLHQRVDFLERVVVSHRNPDYAVVAVQFQVFDKPPGMKVAKPHRDLVRVYLTGNLTRVSALDDETDCRYSARIVAVLESYDATIAPSS